VNAPLGVALLLLTACMNCQACLTHNNYSVKQSLSAAYSVRAATAVSFVERHTCSLVVLSHRLNWLDLLLDAEMKSLNAKKQLCLG